MAGPLILVDVAPRRAADGVAVPFRLAGGGGDEPYPEGYRGSIVQLPKFVAALDFDEKSFGTGGVATASVIEWAASRSDLANAVAHVWEDAEITVRIGDEGSTPPITLNGRVMQATARDGKLQIALADPAVGLKKPFLRDRFEGTGGLEGPIEWAGTIKSRIFGRVWNLPGSPLDPANNIYCFADPLRRLQAFTTVRDKGAATANLEVLDWQGSAAATFAALQDADAPDGGGVACPSIGCIKWWTRPAGDLTADIMGENAGGYVETTARIVERVVASAGGPSFAAGTLTNAAAIRSAAIGLVVNDESTTVAQIMDELLGNVSLLWVLTPLGDVEIREWAWGPSTMRVKAHSVARSRSYRPLAARRTGYRRNQLPMARNSLAAIVLVRDLEVPPEQFLNSEQQWRDILDDDGTRPEDNATVGAPNGTPVGDRNAEDVTEAIDQSAAALADLAETNAEISAEVDAVQAGISELIDTYGSTVAAAASAQSADDSASAAALAAQNSETALGEAQDAVDAAETARDAAATSATNAAGSATASAGSASAALTSENAAENSASAADASRVAAESAATTATDKADAASTSASTAATKATEAGQSASAAQTSATNANTSAGSASTSASAASTSASDAAGSANTATTQAGLAAASRTDAGNSATAAASSASAASSSAGEANTRANSAQNSATNAGTSATAASGSATSAASDAAAAASSATVSARSAIQSTQPASVYREAFVNYWSGDPKTAADTVLPIDTYGTYGSCIRLEDDVTYAIPRAALPVTPGDTVLITTIQEWQTTTAASLLAVAWLDESFNAVEYGYPAGGALSSALTNTPQQFQHSIVVPNNPAIRYVRGGPRKNGGAGALGVFGVTLRNNSAAAAAETSANIASAQAAVATAQASAAQTSSTLAARAASAADQPVAMVRENLVDSWGGNPATLANTSASMGVDGTYGRWVNLTGDGEYIRTRAAIPVRAGGKVQGTTIIEQMGSPATFTMAIAWLDDGYNVLSYSFPTAYQGGLSYNPAGREYDQIVPNDPLIRYARLGVRRDAGVSGTIGVYGLKLLDKSAIGPVEATVSDMRGAAANASGLVAAFIRQIVAASGGNPAMFEMLAGANGSRIGLVADTIALGNAIDGIVETVLRIEGGKAALSDAVIRRLRVAPRAGSAILHEVELRPLEFLAADGETVQYSNGANYGTAPERIEPNYDGLPALAVGESYDIRPANKTGSQFTARAKIISAATLTDRSSGTGSANFSGTPRARTDKPTSDDAYNGDYEFKWYANFTKYWEVNEGGGIYIGSYRGSFDLYIYNGSVHELVGSATISFNRTSYSGPNPTTVNSLCTKVVKSSVDSPSGTSVFGIHPTIDNPVITQIASVKYTTQAAASSRAVPGRIKWLVYPPRE